MVLLSLLFIIERSYMSEMFEKSRGCLIKSSNSMLMGRDLRTRLSGMLIDWSISGIVPPKIWEFGL